MTRVSPLLLILAGVLLMGGCASYSGIAPEVSKLDITTIESRSARFENWPTENWWHQVNDPVLAELIDRAITDSPNIQAVSARLRRASAAAGNAESALWPSIGTSVSTTRERFSERGTVPPPYAGTTRSINDVQLFGQWELDFFGKNRETLRAALGEVGVAETDRQGARQLLAANIARTYFNLARLVAQHALAEERQRQRIEWADLVKRRFAAGIDTKVELETASGVIPENARDIAALDEQIGIARHALAALTGKTPDATDALSPQLPATLPFDLPQTLPANLLAHRADVTAARYRVEAATHAAGATQALFYPNINLRAFTGLTAVGLDHWLESGSRQPGIGMALSLPLFDAGRLRSQYRISVANLDESVAFYNGTLIESLRDVADQLTSLQAVDTQIAHQAATLASAERNRNFAVQRFQADIVDRLAVLNSEMGVLNQRRASIDLQARRIDSQIRLIHALGGGFADAPSRPIAAASHSHSQSNTSN